MFQSSTLVGEFSVHISSEESRADLRKHLLCDHGQSGLKGVVDPDFALLGVKLDTTRTEERKIMLKNRNKQMAKRVLPVSRQKVVSVNFNLYVHLDFIFHRSDGVWNGIFDDSLVHLTTADLNVRFQKLTNAL